MKDVLACIGTNKLNQLWFFRAVPTCEDLYHAGLPLCHRDGVVGGQQWVELLHSHHADRGGHLKYVHDRFEPMQHPWTHLWP